MISHTGAVPYPGTSLWMSNFFARQEGEIMARYRLFSAPASALGKLGRGPNRPTLPANMSWRPIFSPSARHHGGCKPDHERVDRLRLVVAVKNPTITS
jgi:hypothetical protein